MVIILSPYIKAISTLKKLLVFGWRLEVETLAGEMYPENMALACAFGPLIRLAAHAH